MWVFVEGHVWGAGPQAGKGTSNASAPFRIFGKKSKSKKKGRKPPKLIGLRKNRVVKRKP
jgi:hypothetical protein